MACLSSLHPHPQGTLWGSWGALAPGSPHPAGHQLGGLTPRGWRDSRPPSQERAQRLEGESALSASSAHGQGRRSAPHADSPGVGAEHTLPPAHHTCVRALVDGVGDDAQVRLAQRQVAGVGELQGLLVLVPAAGRAGGLGRGPRPTAHPQGVAGQGHSLHFAFLVEYLLAAAEGHVPALRHQPGFGPGRRRSGGHRGERELCSGVGEDLSVPCPAPDPSQDSGTQAHRSRSHNCWGRASS